jgi:hypothetical protein
VTHGIRAAGDLTDGGVRTVDRRPPLASVASLVRRPRIRFRVGGLPGSRWRAWRPLYGLVITTLVTLQTRQLNRHSPPPSSRGTSTLRCIRTSQVAHFGVGILLSALHVGGPRSPGLGH